MPPLPFCGIRFVRLEIIERDSRIGFRLNPSARARACVLRLPTGTIPYTVPGSGYDAPYEQHGSDDLVL